MSSEKQQTNGPSQYIPNGNSEATGPGAITNPLIAPESAEYAASGTVKYDELTADDLVLARPSQRRLSLRDFEPPDGGWGWLVCVASFWTNGTIFGILNTFGILYVELVREFKTGDEDIAFKTSWIGAFQISMTFFMSPVASILVDRFGIQKTSFVGAFLATVGMFASSFVYRLEVLYLTYGLLLGVGSSLIYTPSMIILGHYFKRKLGIVNGLVSFGSAVFTTALSFMMKETLRELGLRNTMRVLGGLFCVLLVCPFIWKPLFDTRHKELDHYLSSNESVHQRCCGFYRWMSKFLNFSIWRNRGYVIWATALPIAFLGYFIPFVHLVSHTNNTMPGANAELLVICLGAMSGVSRLVVGKLADLPCVNRIRMQQVAFVIFGIATGCIPFANHFGILISLVLVMGACDGCFVCLMGPIAFDLLGPSGAAQGLGCLFGLMAIPMTAGPPLAGLAFDYMKTYSVVLHACAAPPIIGAIVLFFVPKTLRHKEVLVDEVKAVNMTETMAAMSMENLDKIDSDHCEEVYVPGKGYAKLAEFDELLKRELSLPPHMRKEVLKNYLSEPNLFREENGNSVFKSDPMTLHKV